MFISTVLFLFPATVFGAYSYYYSETANIPANWNTNGNSTFASAGGGSRISNLAVPGGANEYEVRTVLNIKSSGGTFTTYLRASSDALTGTDAGSYYAIDLENVQLSGGSCTGGLNVYKRVGSQIYTIANYAVPCKDGMTWRIIRNSGGVWIHSDLGVHIPFGDFDIATGKPGFGGRNLAGGSGFASVSLGPPDLLPPTLVSQQSVAASVSANQVDLQWQGVSDDFSTTGDNNGSGFLAYFIYRDGEFITSLVPPAFSDPTVHHNETHTYTIWVADYHGTLVSG